MKHLFHITLAFMFLSTELTVTSCVGI